MRADLIKYWKIICSNVAGYNLSVMFQRTTRERMRGHRFRLVMKHCNTDVRYRSFNVSHIRIWNQLPGRVVEAKSLVAFTASLADLRGALFDY